MTFVPSAKGISHNPRGHTDPADLCRDAIFLLDVMHVITHAALMGGNVRVGLEDSLYLGGWELASPMRSRSS